MAVYPIPGDSADESEHLSFCWQIRDNVIIVNVVIASAAKQSRARCARPDRDCFGALRLAMTRSSVGVSPDFSYRVRFRAAMTCATAEPIEENGGCGLDRRVTTFASPYGRNGPPGGLRGLFGRRFLVRQAVAAAAKRGVSDVVLGLIRKGSRHGELDAAHAGAH